MANPMDEILQLLACPCDKHGALTREGDVLVSACCGSRFRIEEGIPVLLPQGENSGS